MENKLNLYIITSSSAEKLTVTAKDLTRALQFWEEVYPHLKSTAVIKINGEDEYYVGEEKILIYG